jgi:glycerol kinase
MERDLDRSVKALKVDGGATANDFLMQFQADILSAKVVRPNCLESTALGSAFLAGLKSGFWKDRQSLPQDKNPSEFKPILPEPKRRELILAWAEAVARAKVK